MSQQTNSLGKGNSKESIKAIITDSIEVLIDLKLGEGILKDIPITGTLTNLAKTITSIRDYFFFKKLATFFEDLDSIAEEEKTTFLERYASDEEAQRKLGSQIITYLDRFDDIDKSKLLAMAFKAYIKGEIQYKELLDLTLLINNLKMHYLKEILYIIMRKGYTHKELKGYIREQEDLYPTLQSDGLLLRTEEAKMTQPRRGLGLSHEEPVPVINIEYRTSKLGLLFIKHVVPDICYKIVEEDRIVYETKYNPRPR